MERFFVLLLTLLAGFLLGYEFGKQTALKKVGSMAKKLADGLKEYAKKQEEQKEKLNKDETNETA